MGRQHYKEALEAPENEMDLKRLREKGLLGMMKYLEELKVNFNGLFVLIEDLDWFCSEDRRTILDTLNEMVNATDKMGLLIVDRGLDAEHDVFKDAAAIVNPVLQEREDFGLLTKFGLLQLIDAFAPPEAQTHFRNGILRRFFRVEKCKYNYFMFRPQDDA